MALQELPYPDEDRGPRLAATYIAGCAISLIFVTMRLCARYSIAGVGIDDWCMLVTWVGLEYYTHSLVTAKSFRLSSSH